jgi:demethylmenaquinone methyltransferase / 2-methoxy-6-polyprenyl-1,4-benzoquinol methylase
MSRAVAPVAEAVNAIDDHGKKVQAMFSDISHGYDLANRLMSLGTDIRWRRRAVATLLPTGPSGATHDERPRILDLCAGTLDSTRTIHRAFPTADLIGGDFSAGMLSVGASHLSLAERDRITPQHMDAHDLPVDDANLDAIFCAFGVRNLSDVPRATKEALRVLKPGGQLTVLEFFRPRALATRLFHAIYNRTVLPVVGWMCTGNLDAYLYLPRSIAAFRDVEDYADILKHAGFTEISVEPLTFGVASIVRARRPSGPTKSMIAEAP